MPDDRPKPAQGTPPWVLKGSLGVGKQPTPRAGTPPWVLRVTLELSDAAPEELRHDGLSVEDLPRVLGLVSKAISVPSAAADAPEAKPAVIKAAAAKPQSEAA